ncbi:hypothetical protein fugu_017124 [Takifugu bimaculatus]|uniref:Ig-like domain-containing protein n=1 Tax=Takifugu bimaculatus TaxID=433685 RepID=A0A4Z2BUY6_9TELE|nr:hypothetical protein fugu_017124 [Takifugu bimaculatus]
MEERRCPSVQQQASPAAQRVPADRPPHKAPLWLVPVCGDAGAGARPPLHLPLCHRRIRSAEPDLPPQRRFSSVQYRAIRLVSAGNAVRTTARLPCEIVPASALQSVSIQWTKDGQISSDSRYQQLPDADLRITTAPNNIQVSEGGAARLPCVVSGDNVSIGWSRNGVPVRPDGRSVLLSPDGSLLLQQVKPSDEGTYTCNAYTGIYSVSATAQVHVTRAADAGTAAPPGCSDRPELANCRLIVFARLCSNSYYSSFCCASCTRHSQRSARFAGRRG